MQPQSEAAQVRFSWRALNRFQKWAIATVIVVYILILIGGFVRAAGAGLGCPDWPKCFGYWWPPSTASQIVEKGFKVEDFNYGKMWIEYSNRIAGVLTGFFIMITTFFAIRDYRHNRRVLWSTVAAFVLTLFQGWLGGKVVHLELEGWIVTAHMILALVIVSLLLYAAVCAFFPNGQPIANIPAERRKVARWGQVLTAFGLIQLTLGAFVRGHIDDVSSKLNIPRSEWVANVGIIDPLHRTSAIVLTALVLIATYIIIHERKLHPWIQRTAWVMSGLVLTQVAAGIGLAYASLPPVLQNIHLTVGNLLIGAMTLLVLLAYRLPVTSAEQASARSEIGGLASAK